MRRHSSGRYAHADSLRRFLQGAAETKEPVVISKSRRLLGAPISYGVNVATADEMVMLKYMSLCVCGRIPKVYKKLSSEYGAAVFDVRCERGCRSSSTVSANFLTATSAKAAVLETMEKVCIDWNEAVSPHRMD